MSAIKSVQRVCPGLLYSFFVLVLTGILIAIQQPSFPTATFSPDRDSIQKQAFQHHSIHDAATLFPAVQESINDGSAVYLDLEGRDLSQEVTDSLKKLPALDSLNLGGAKLPPTLVQNLVDCENLRYLDLSAIKLESKTTVLLPKIPNLEELVLCGNELNHESFRHVTQCNKLKKLAILDSTIPGDWLAGIAAFPNLEELVLDTVSIDRLDLQLLPKLEKLRRLEIGFGGKQAMDGRNFESMIAPVFQCKHLVSLKILGQVPLSPETHGGLQKMKELQTLRLSSDTPLRLEALDSLVSLRTTGTIASLPISLQNLDVSDNRSFTGCELEVCEMPELTSANFRDSTFKSESLVFLSKFSKLKNLDLGGVRLSSIGHEELLASIGKLEQLEHLKIHLDGGPKDSTKLAFLLNNISLKELDLGLEILTPDDQKILKKLVGLTTLSLSAVSVIADYEYLNEHGHPFEMLEDATNLKHLKLVGQDFDKWCLVVGHEKAKRTKKYVDPVKNFPNLIELVGWTPYEADEYQSRGTLQLIRPGTEYKPNSAQGISDIPFVPSGTQFLKFPIEKKAFDSNRFARVRFYDSDFSGIEKLNWRHGFFPVPRLERTSSINDALANLIVVKTRRATFSIDGKDFTAQRILKCYVGGSHLVDIHYLDVPQEFEYAWQKIQDGSITETPSSKFTTLSIPTSNRQPRYWREGQLMIGVYIKRGEFVEKIMPSYPDELGISSTGHFFNHPGIPTPANTNHTYGQTYFQMQEFSEWFENWLKNHYPVDLDDLQAAQPKSLVAKRYVSEFEKWLQGQ